MKNYILYENGYAKVFYKNIDDKIAENIRKTLTDNQQLKATSFNSLPTNELPPLSEEELNNRRINELKQYLVATDYKAIKYAEGLLTDEEYAETKAQRQAWRAEINKLEEGGENE